MANEFCDFVHGRVSPQVEQILAVPMSTQNLLLVPVPLQRADLHDIRAAIGDLRENNRDCQIALVILPVHQCQCY